MTLPAPPPPPSISPEQMNVLRIIASMAWSDGNLADEEADLMLDRFSGMFAADAPQKAALQEELRDYLMQNIPLNELVPRLQTNAERELVLKLGYEVIHSSARTPDEALVNVEEAEAYRELVELLGFAPETVSRIQAEALSSAEDGEPLVQSLSRQLEEFLQQ
ncbi:TerB family tellurite resistance protein [Vacuolonema iberomarrocanum]|uniref:tellurite resistance TerB family protein n=1 Tax=Vacuolonema iberomarrocanum TaxID=3454632 RepID=UPI0019E8ABC7|nr:TerB family tellurite resistance protein [filamentous cyanobacterium LEGE 07170]